MLSKTEATESDLEPNTAFEVGWYRFQVGLQILIGIIIIAGLAGAFGNGMLSRAASRFPGAPISLTYERFLRANAPADFVLKLEEPLPKECLEVAIGARLLDHVSIGSTQPRARSVDATPQGVTYTFDLTPERQGSITFRISPRKVGSLDADMTVAGARLTLPLLVYP